MGGLRWCNAVAVLQTRGGSNRLKRKVSAAGILTLHRSVQLQTAGLRVRSMEERGEEED